MLDRGRSDDLEDRARPTLEDLAECILFSPGDGRVWLTDQRVVLLPTATFGRLRTELLDLLGPERTRAVLTRVGYAQGSRDAQLIRSRWPDSDTTHYLAAGPRIHTLEGYVKAETVRFEYDIARGHYYGEFLWHESVEAAEHLSANGVASQPQCWLQIAYPTGYTSWLFGKLVLFREVECRATGAPHCRCIGKPIEEWGEATDEVEQQLAGQWRGVPRKRRRVAERTGAEQAAGPAASDATETRERSVVGVSSAFITARHMLERVAATDATVLLAGESGVGKELFARTLHEISRRQRGPFVAINCAAIPESLMEAELFGVERGAYTGAHASRMGRFERADGGTLFLDEIGSLSLVSQGKLLRALQEREIERVGGARVLRPDVRVVAATNIDLQGEVRAGRFREDLYFRLNVFQIALPALRERRDDIPLLMDHFLRHYSRRHGVRIAGFTQRAFEALLAYDYPGNVRELQNLIERGVVLAEPGSRIDAAHMFRAGERWASSALQLGPRGQLERAGGGSHPAPDDRSAATDHRVRVGDGAGAATATIDPAQRSAETFDGLERRAYSRALEQQGGNVAAAARSLGLSRATLEYRLRRLGLRSSVRRV